jgi:small conductance mechanosensitive channel
LLESVWSAFAASLYRYVLPLALIVITTLIALRLVNMGAAAIERRFIAPSEDADRRERLQTLVKAGKYTLRAIILTVGALIGLSTIGINIGPALAAVGVLGLAVSLGAQTLIKDVIGGLTILLEDEFRIGDSVKIGAISGDVERISLRRTDVRDAEGRVHMIPNGEIRTAANETRDWAYALVELNFGFDADVDRAVITLEEGLVKLAGDARVKPHLLSVPEIFGYNGFSDWGVVVRMRAKVTAGKQSEVARIMRQHALAALGVAGVPVEVPSYSRANKN